MKKSKNEQLHLMRTAILIIQSTSQFEHKLHKRPVPKMNQCIRLTLPIAQFRGFTSQHANQVLLQPEESSQLIVICLNNCEDGADRPTALGNFAKSVCDEILEKEITR